MKTEIAPRNLRSLVIKIAWTLAATFLAITGLMAAPTPTLEVNGKIAFTRLPDGSVNPEIYVMNPDGSNQTNLTNSLMGRRRTWWHGDHGPAWSPDGARIVFARQGVPGAPVNEEIFVMNADGSDETRLTIDPNYDRSPAWSPDGQNIVFASLRDSCCGFQIYVMDADGSNPVRLTNSSSAGDIVPVWSPDGARIAFVRVTTYQTGAASEIYVMDADGSNQTRLTDNPGRWNESPAWSPDGARIAFDSNRGVNSYEIYVMNADGSNQIALSNNPAFDMSPEWSPDGAKIAFTSTRDGRQAIYVMDADGSNQIRLTSNLTSNDGGPRWQRLPAPPAATPPPTPTATASPTR